LAFTIDFVRVPDRRNGQLCVVAMGLDAPSQYSTHLYPEKDALKQSRVT
jgi:hypothetical protein